MPPNAPVDNSNTIESFQMKEMSFDWYQAHKTTSGLDTLAVDSGRAGHTFIISNKKYTSRDYKDWCSSKSKNFATQGSLREYFKEILNTHKFNADIIENILNKIDKSYSQTLLGFSAVTYDLGIGSCKFTSRDNTFYINDDATITVDIRETDFELISSILNEERDPLKISTVGSMKLDVEYTEKGALIKSYGANHPFFEDVFIPKQKAEDENSKPTYEKLDYTADSFLKKVKEVDFDIYVEPKIKKIKNLNVSNSKELQKFIKDEIKIVRKSNFADKELEALIEVALADKTAKLAMYLLKKNAFTRLLGNRAIENRLTENHILLLITRHQANKEFVDFIKPRLNKKELIKPSNSLKSIVNNRSLTECVNDGEKLINSDPSESSYTRSQAMLVKQHTPHLRTSSNKTSNSLDSSEQAAPRNGFFSTDEIVIQLESVKNLKLHKTSLGNGVNPRHNNVFN